MQHSTIKNYCLSWLEVIESFTDKEYQRRVWFKREGKECDSYEEATQHLIERGKRKLQDPNSREYVSEKCHETLLLLFHAVVAFDQEKGSIGAEETLLHADPAWDEICTLAQKSVSFLQQRIEEVSHVEPK